MWPDVSDALRALLRTGYGISLLVTLLLAARHGKRYFVSERWGGYGQSSPAVDLLQNPVVYPIVMSVWLACGALLVVGQWVVWAALLNWALCHHNFVRMRWSSLVRGLGAPGFLTNWVATAVFLLEFTSHHAPSLRPLAVLTLQADYAFVMMSAGIFKRWSGYANDRGFEYALNNPQWTYWSHLYKNVRPDHWVFKVFNQLAWSSEIAIALLILIPTPITRMLGGLLNVGLFCFIVTQLRLAFLCPMAILASLTCFAPGSPIDAALSPLASFVPVSTSPELAMPAAVGSVVGLLLWGYLVLLPFAHGGLWINVYGRKALPKPFQLLLERYTNHFGMIVWRVFSYDIVSFCVHVYREPKERPGERTQLSHYTRIGGRFNDVGEPLVLTCIFNLLRYYTRNRSIFNERMLRYARTLDCPNDARLVFENCNVRKTKTGFALVPVAEYFVDPAAGTVEESILEVAADAGTQPAHVAHEGSRPGSYAPIGT